MEITGIRKKDFTEIIKPVLIPELKLGASEEVIKLETRLAEYTGTQRCVVTPSGTYALLTALRACGVRHGDGVMCTPFSYLATSEIIALTGAVPVQVDTNPNTFNVDPYCIEYVLKKCARRKLPMPKALVAADLFGLPCDFDAIEEICGRYNVALIEDMSCAFGALYKGRNTGNFGRFSIASFFPSRPFGGDGDGGGIFCRTREDAKILEGLISIKKSRAFNFVGVNLVGEKLTAYSEELSRRQLVAARYRDNLNGFVTLQQYGPEYVSSCTQFVIALEDEKGRDFVAEALREKQIPCSAVSCFERVLPAGNEWESVVLTNTQKISKRLLAIPIHPYLSVRVIDYISECIMESAEASKLRVD